MAADRDARSPLRTGTGKTSIAFQIAWKLFSARWNLIDWESGAEPSAALVFFFSPTVTILPIRLITTSRPLPHSRMMPWPASVRIISARKARFRKTPACSLPSSNFHERAERRIASLRRYFGEYPPDFFDFIVIDDAIAAVQMTKAPGEISSTTSRRRFSLVLPRRPKRKDNVDTYKYFGEPVYTYSLKEGINDGFLTPFRVKQIATTLDEYVYTPDDQVVEGEIESGKRYTETDFNKIIEIKAREVHRVRAVHGADQPERKDAGFLRHAGSRARRAGSYQSDEDDSDPNYCQRSRQTTANSATNISGIFRTTNGPYRRF